VPDALTHEAQTPVMNRQRSSWRLNLKVEEQRISEKKKGCFPAHSGF